MGGYQRMQIIKLLTMQLLRNTKHGFHFNTLYYILYYSIVFFTAGDCLCRQWSVHHGLVYEGASQCLFTITILYYTILYNEQRNTRVLVGLEECVIRV